MAKCTFGKETVSKVVEVGDFGVVLGRKPVDRKELLISVESEVPCVVVGEIQRVRTVANDKELNKAQERLGITVSGVTLVLDDLFHRPTRANPKCLELNLDYGDTVDQEHDIIAVMTVVRIDAKLMDDFKSILAPVPDVDEGVVERCAVVTGERFAVSNGACRFVHVRCNDFVKETLELAVA